MIFLACHPSFKIDERIILSLKTVGGLSTKEIAAGLLLKKSNVDKKLTRLKNKIKEENIQLIHPDNEELSDRINNVLSTLYLMFNEAHKNSSGEQLVDTNLCKDSIRLLSVFIGHKNLNSSKAHALMALFMFQTSRFKSRLDENFQTILLKDQDRSLWDKDLIHMGLTHLDQAMTGNELSAYHLEAGIAACHCTAPSFEKTNWQQILEFYEILLKINPSPIVFLNRTIAYSEVHGAKEAITELKKIENDKRLVNYYYLDATFGDFYEKINEVKKAQEYFKKALSKVENSIEKAFLEKKLQNLST